MTLATDHGFILRVRPYRETSVMVHWFTLQNGRITTAARAARNPKSPLLGKIDLCIEADFSFHKSTRSDVHTLAEVQVTDFHPLLRRDIASITLLAHVVGCLEQVTETEAPLPELFEVYRGFIGFLERHGPRPRALFAWELQFLSLYGLDPTQFPNAFDPAAQLLLLSLLNEDWETLSRVKFDAKAVRDLGNFLSEFWTQQFGRLPKTRAPAFKAADEAARARRNLSSEFVETTKEPLG